MSRTVTVILALAVGLAAGIPLGTRVMPQAAPDDEEGAVSTAFAAVPGEIGAQDVSGPYTPADWPKNLSTLPGHDKWTWGAAQGIFAESPNRVYLLARGELPNLTWKTADGRTVTDPPTTKLAELGPSLQFPVG